MEFLYLTDAVIRMPSPQNHISYFFNLAAARFGNGRSAKSKLFTTSISLIPSSKFKLRPRSGRILNFEFCQLPVLLLLATITSLIPKLNIQNSTAAAADFFIFASCHYLLNTKIQNCESVLLLLATITSLILKFKNRPRQRPIFDFCQLSLSFI